MNGPSESRRIHVVLPSALVADIDKLVGERGRSAFLARIASSEVKRQRLLAILKDPRPIWRLEDHPELKHGSAAWVRKLRGESDAAHRRRMRRR